MLNKNPEGFEAIFCSQYDIDPLCLKEILLWQRWINEIKLNVLNRGYNVGKWAVTQIFKMHRSMSKNTVIAAELDQKNLFKCAK